MKTIVTPVCLFFATSVGFLSLAVGQVQGKTFAHCQTADKSVMVTVAGELGRGIVLRSWKNSVQTSNLVVEVDQNDPRGLVYKSTGAELLIPNMQGPGNDGKPKGLLLVQGAGSETVLCNLN